MATIFNVSWLTHPKYIGWLEAVKGVPTASFCRPCHKTIVLSNMGRRALDSHATSKKHIQSISTGMKSSDIKDFFHGLKGPVVKTENPHENNKASEDGNEENTIDESSLVIPPPPPVAGVSQDPNCQTDQHNITEIVQPAPPLSRWLQSKESRKAEILWTLKCVQNHQSFRDNEHTSQLFQNMFWDSNIARQYSLGKTKMAYLTTFGLSPYFKDMLLNNVRQSDFFMVIFDEAFNDILQKEQMDILVRFWRADEVVTRYLGSQFLGSAKSEDLLQALKAGIAGLDLRKLIQIGMDGPNVNLKLHKLFVEDRKKIDPDLPELIDIGTCSLHVVHGALQTGIKKSNWELDQLLKSLWWLFHNTYQRRTSYTEITKSTLFPLHFCSTRWVEDAAVATRAIEIWPNIKKYVTEIVKRKQSEIPSCSSFNVVREAVQTDKLVVAKLEMFRFIAGMMKPFLTKYQDEKPLVIFLGTDLALLMSDLMELFVKPEVLNENRTGYKLANLDVSANVKSPKQINIGSGARLALQQSEASELQKLDFMNCCSKMLVAVVTKLQERCPLKYSFLRAFRVFNPKVMVENPTASLQTVTSKLVSSKQRTIDDCDAAELQYERLVREEKVRLENFDPNVQRLDEFFHDLLSGKQEYHELWKLIQFVLVLSQGQAAAERSFSVNDDILLPNMKSETLCAIKTVYDAIKSLDIKVHEFKVPDEMLKYCSHARAKYSIYMDTIKAEKTKEAEKRKAAATEDQYTEAKKKLKVLEEEASACLKAADKKAKESLKKHNFKLLAQSVALREKGNAMMNKEVIEQSNIVQELKNKLN